MATLQARLAQGDHAAFAELYDAYADRIGHYLLVRLSSPDDANYVLQETFFRIARVRHKLAKVQDLEAYIFTIARNEGARLAASKLCRRRQHKSLIATPFCFPSGDTEAREAAETVAMALTRS